MEASETFPEEVAKRSSYTLEAESKLGELTVTIGEIYSKADLAVATSGLEKSEHLARIKFQVASQLAIVGRHLEQLKSAENEMWSIHKHEFESCSEDLLRSIKNLVAWTM